MSSCETEEKANEAQESSTQFSDLKFCGNLAKGATCEVKLYRHSKTGVQYAVKVLMQEKLIKNNQVNQALRERNILLQLRDSPSPYLESLAGVCKDKDHLYFVLPYANSGALHRHIRAGFRGRLPVDQARSYAAELISALETLHSLSIVYRDLKASNVVLRDNGHILLVDYGFAKNLKAAEEYRTYTFCGTRHSMAPEMFHPHHDQVGHSFEVDWWALGVLIFEMLAGSPPWEYFYPNQIRDIEAYDAVIRTGLKPEMFAHHDWDDSEGHKHARTVVEQLLSLLPDQRTKLPLRDLDWFSLQEPKVEWSAVDQGINEVPAFNTTLGEIHNNCDDEKDALTKEQQALFADF